MIVLALPYPPTANTIWIRASKGMRRSEGYLNWLEEASWAAKQQKPGKIAGPYSLNVEAIRPDKRKRDLDNILKPVSDLLMKIGVIADDSLCQSLSASWIKAKGEQGIVVRVSPAAERVG